MEQILRRVHANFKNDECAVHRTLGFFLRSSFSQKWMSWEEKNDVKQRNIRHPLDADCDCIQSHKRLDLYEEDMHKKHPTTMGLEAPSLIEPIE